MAVDTDRDLPRPKTDIAATRRKLLEATDRLLKSHGAGGITVSAVAAACGMSQPNAYRFFASKRALLEAVGENWFAEIEAELATIARDGSEPSQQLVRYLVRQYDIKRGRHARDPKLFAAYLELGLANMSIVERHLKRMHQELLTIMRGCGRNGLLGRRTPEEAAALFDAMTARFRDPGQIMRFRNSDSAKRVADAARVFLAGLHAGGGVTTR